MKPAGNLDARPVVLWELANLQMIRTKTRTRTRTKITCTVDTKKISWRQSFTDSVTWSMHEN
jgi:hypothetical protein